MCWKNPYSVSVIVVMTCPVVRRLVVVHKVTVTWMNPVYRRLVIRTYLHRLAWMRVSSWLHPWSVWFWSRSGNRSGRTCSRTYRRFVRRSGNRSCRLVRSYLSRTAWLRCRRTGNSSIRLGRPGLSTGRRLGNCCRWSLYCSRRTRHRGRWFALSRTAWLGYSCRRTCNRC